MSNARDSVLVERLRTSGLLTKDQLDRAEALAARDADDRSLADRLVAEGLLTAYQAKQILGGRVKGFLVGPYTILDELGRGGMGTVFRAEHRDLRRTVALKVLLKARRADPDAQARFMREARASAQLEHPNIVTIYEVGRHKGVTFLAMQLLEGQDLSALIRARGRVPPDQAAHIAGQVAVALEHARRHGIVHRDIKPPNILIDGQGTAKVLDMGLARIDRDDDEESQPLTRDGELMGTPDYLAPEQATDTHTVDTRADIYSLGCTLYHMLTGHVPFPGGNLTQKLVMHQLREPTPIAELAPDVPAALAAVTAKMMAKQPEDRYQTPAEAAEALAPWAGIDGAPLGAGAQRAASGPPSVTQPTPKALDADAAARVRPSVRPRVVGRRGRLRAWLFRIAATAGVCVAAAFVWMQMFGPSHRPKPAKVGHRAAKAKASVTGGEPRVTTPAPTRPRASPGTDGKARPTVAPKPTSDGPTAKSVVRTAPGPADAVTERGRALAEQLLDAARSAEKIAGLVKDASPEELQAAVATIADGLAGLGGPTRRVQATDVFNKLRAIPLQADLQRALMDALLASPTLAERNAASSNLGRLLNRMLFLSDSTLRMTSSSGQGQFADMCRRTWEESCRRHPADPMHDPRRLANAVAAGAPFRNYTAHADPQHVIAVVAELTPTAADPASDGSSRAMQALSQLAGASSGVTPAVRTAARTALCNVVRQTSDATVANTAYYCVHSALSAYKGGPARRQRGSLATAADRQAAADELEDFMRTGPPLPGLTSPTALQALYATGSTDVEALFVDLAVTMLACTERASHFTGEPFTGGYRLRMGLMGTAGAQRGQYLTQNVTLAAATSPAPKATPPAKAAPAPRVVAPDFLEPLATQLDSGEIGHRYRAIETLRASGIPEAANVLLKKLARLAGAREPSPMLYRVLRALMAMNAPDAPRRLVEIVGQCRNPMISFSLVQALIKGTGTSVSSNPDCYLPLAHDTRARQKCLAWWQGEVARGSLTWGAEDPSTLLAEGRPPTPGRPGAAKAAALRAAAALKAAKLGQATTPPAWEPDPMLTKLVGLTAHYAKQMAGGLKAYRWGKTAGAGVASLSKRVLGISARRRRASSMTIEPICVSPSAVGAELAEALDTMVEQINRLIGEHAKGKDMAPRAGKVLARMNARKLASDTRLQKLVVSLDAAAELLDVLVEASQPATVKTDPTTRSGGTPPSTPAPARHVLQQARASAYALLVAWDRVLRQQARGPSGATGTPKGGQ